MLVFSGANFLSLIFLSMLTPLVISSCPVDFNIISMLMIPSSSPDLSLEFVSLTAYLIAPLECQTDISNEPYSKVTS